MDAPLFKIGETVLVFLLAVHMLGGIRVLLIENMAWREGQKTLATGALVIAAIAGLAFLVRAI
jgi:fumarate reductase subunit D